MLSVKNKNNVSNLNCLMTDYLKIIYPNTPYCLGYLTNVFLTFLVKDRYLICRMKESTRFTLKDVQLGHRIHEKFKIHNGLFAEIALFYNGLSVLFLG